MQQARIKNTTNQAQLLRALIVQFQITKKKKKKRLFYSTAKEYKNPTWLIFSNCFHHPVRFKDCKLPLRSECTRAHGANYTYSLVPWWSASLLCPAKNLKVHYPTKNMIGFDQSFPLYSEPITNEETVYRVKVLFWPYFLFWISTGWGDVNLCSNYAYPI